MDVELRCRSRPVHVWKARNQMCELQNEPSCSSERRCSILTTDSWVIWTDEATLLIFRGQLFLIRPAVFILTGTSASPVWLNQKWCRIYSDPVNFTERCIFVDDYLDIYTTEYALIGAPAQIHSTIFMRLTQWQTGKVGASAGSWNWSTSAGFCS